jgi:hypothetical protein
MVVLSRKTFLPMLRMCWPFPEEMTLLRTRLRTFAKILIAGLPNTEGNLSFLASHPMGKHD